MTSLFSNPFRSISILEQLALPRRCLVLVIRGRPLPIAWRERIQMVGVLLLAALFVAVLVSDVSDWLAKPG